MLSYDVEQQRQKAIAQLTAKSQHIKRFVEVESEAFSYIKAGLRKQVFATHCEAARNRYYNCGAFRDHPDQTSISSYATRYVKLEVMIHRLKTGEDPRLILLEIVSSND